MKTRFRKGMKVVLLNEIRFPTNPITMEHLTSEIRTIQRVEIHEAFDYGKYKLLILEDSGTVMERDVCTLNEAIKLTKKEIMRLRQKLYYYKSSKTTKPTETTI